MVSEEWLEEGGKTQYCLQLPAPIDAIPECLLTNDKVRCGQFASFRKIGETTYEAIRDPLGIEKLFYTETGDGQIYFSKIFSSLFHHHANIFSVPPGSHVRIGAFGQRELLRNIGPDKTANTGLLSLETLEKGLRNQAENPFRKKLELRLKHVFSTIRYLEETGWNIFVALSGGLDSSSIANTAITYLENPTACTLDLGSSEDARQARRIAKRIGIKHISFNTSQEEIVKTLAQTPALCQDFRDFNVHCATLNLLLAKNIRTWVDLNNIENGDKVMVLTGDMMNEFTCDYAGEIIDGIEYYKLPRIAKKNLQTFLIRGLDTSDRELLPFRHYGIRCVQPYAAVFDLFTGLDERILSHQAVKKCLLSFLIPPGVMDLVPTTKLRAQVGSRENMGILGICHKLNLLDKDFKKSLLDQSGIPGAKMPIFIGRYDVEKFV